MKKIRIANCVLICIAVVCAGIATFYAHAAWAQSAEPAAAAVKEMSPMAMMVGFISAALAVGISSIGAAFAVSNVGTAAIGALAEKPEITGRALIFVGLAEGIAIYGLIVAIMILGML
ncbi:MAG: ATP synthase subunit C [Spirochaetota bacterium]